MKTESRDVRLSVFFVDRCLSFFESRRKSFEIPLLLGCSRAIGSMIPR
uniref:Uncharacterized protein n=1 Tax=Amphimedon queenslandica TaxID=400682 RepID=A0A1X7UUP6_AMPQE